MVDVQLVDGLADARAHLGHDGPALGALQHHAGGEQPLDDEIVQVTGDPVAVLVDREPLPVALGVGQHQRQRGLRGELGGQRPLHR